MLFSRSMTSAAAIAIVVASTSFAAAATDQEITDALAALIKSGDTDVTVTLGTPTSEDGALVYADVKITTTGEDAAETTIQALTVAGGDLNADGGLVAETIIADLIEAKSASGTATIEAIEVTGVDAGKPPAAGEETMGQFDSLSLAGISFSEPGKPPVNVAAVTVEVSDYVNGYPHAIGFAVDGIEIDPAMAGEGDQTAAQLKELGYEQVVLSVTASGTWDEAAGVVELEDLTVDGLDMGAISLTGTLGGFTSDVVKQLDQPNPPPELMEKITLSNLALSYADASLATRLIEMQAKQMGTDAATFVQQISAALPLMLTAIQNPPFQEKVAAAAAAFLQDPQSITISVAPAAPASLMSIMMAAQTAPQTLPDALNANITANESE